MSHTTMIASTAAVTATAARLAWGASAISWPILSRFEPASAGRPSAAGSCETAMCTAMPARKPKVTGAESRLPIQPVRKMPAAATMIPTIRASPAARAA